MHVQVSVAKTLSILKGRLSCSLPWPFRHPYCSQTGALISTQLLKGTRTPWEDMTEVEDHAWLLQMSYVTKKSFRLYHCTNRGYKPWCYDWDSLIRLGIWDKSLLALHKPYQNVFSKYVSILQILCVAAYWFWNWQCFARKFNVQRQKKNHSGGKCN